MSDPVSEKRTTAKIAVWALVVLGLGAAFYQTFADMWLRWFPAWNSPHYGLYDRIMEGESYYTHGPLVPAISLVIVMLLLRHTRVPVKPSPSLGFTVLGLSVLVHLSASFARVMFVSGFALIGLLAGLVLVFWGRAALRRFWFPIALLAFMVPLPDVTISELNFRLKMVATEVGVGLANMVGIIAERGGNRVYLEGDKSLVVANVCNGLRTLISVIGFGALYAYVCRLRGGWRILLFAMSVPVAVVANSIRVVSLIAVADLFTVKAATGVFHEVSGLMIYVLAFLMMFGMERLILWSRAAAGRPAKELPLFHDVRRGPEDEGQGARVAAAPASPRGWTAVAVVLAVAALAIWLNRSVPSTWTGRVAAAALPAQMDVAGRTWQGFSRELSLEERIVLETDDYLYREYMSPGMRPVSFCIIFSKDNRKGTHPPDLCLQGSGEGIVYKGAVEVPRPAGQALPCRELLVQAGRAKWYYLYTYKCGGAYTGSFWVQQATIFWNGLVNRNASGALIRLSTSADDGLAAARERAAVFLGAAIGHLDRALP